MCEGYLPGGGLLLRSDVPPLSFSSSTRKRKPYRTGRCADPLSAKVRWLKECFFSFLLVHDVDNMKGNIDLSKRIWTMMGVEGSNPIEPLGGDYSWDCGSQTSLPYCLGAGISPVKQQTTRSTRIKSQWWWTGDPWRIETNKRHAITSFRYLMEEVVSVRRYRSSAYLP